MGISTLSIHLFKDVLNASLLKLILLVAVLAMPFVLNKLITCNNKIIKSSRDIERSN